MIPRIYVVGEGHVLKLEIEPRVTEDREERVDIEELFELTRADSKEKVLSDLQE